MEQSSRKTSKEPKVIMFGNEISEKECRHCHDHHEGSAWGMFILCIGILFLCNTLGIIPWSAWEMLKRFWPVILIVIGLDTIVGRSGPGRLLGMIAGFGIFGTILGVVFIRVAPQLLTWLPQNILDYLIVINGMVPNTL